MSLKLCEDSSEEEETEKNIGIQPQKIEEQVEKLQTLQLSMQSKEGFTSNKSFKVWVKVKDKELLTLIDSGATNNFIDSRLVKELDLKVVETPTYVIEVGNGQRVKNQGMCEELTFEMQGMECYQHFFFMDLGRSDMVLGMDWLASLGNIEANFGDLCLKWE